jgi:Skp family chaperone for outer membrane proteins
MSNQKILELEATLKDTTSSTEITDLKKSLNRTMTRYEEESTRTKNQIDELQKQLDNSGKSKRLLFELFLK